MRIIAGRFRGRIIKTPPGRKTRPTPARAREALFSRLDALGAIGGAYVLDAFAGSGALGLEALSRGAAHVTFVDQDNAAISILYDNLSALGVGDEVKVVKANVLQMKVGHLVTDQAYSLLLLDPPYRIDKSEVKAFMESLTAYGGLSRGAYVVWEHAAGEPSAWPVGFVPLGVRRYGTTEIDIAVSEEGSP